MGIISFDVSERLESAVREATPESIEIFEKHLDKTMYGAKSVARRDPADPLEAVNILTVLERVSKAIDPGVKAAFESLSEFAHPNASGVLVSYEDLDVDNGFSSFQDEPARHTPFRVASHLGPSNFALQLFIDGFERAEQSLPAWIKLCEAGRE